MNVPSPAGYLYPTMPPSSRSFRLALFAVVLLAACRPAFVPATFKGTNDALYAATMKEYRARRWDNAVAGFERLTLELAARDTLLPLAHYWLAHAHGHRKEHLLAAQAFARVTESWPESALADDALWGAARSYQKLWRKPTLDAQYGQSALATYRLYLAMFPNGDRRAAADAAVRELEQSFATKDYENGMFYLRRKYYDSAIIYFKTVVSQYPETPRARDAYLRLAETYRAIRYAEDARDACAALQARWPQDAEVRATCTGVPASAAAPDSARRVSPDTAARPPTPPARR